MDKSCDGCKFLPYCERHEAPCILEAEPAQVIENMDYCPKCDEVVKTRKHFTPSCFIVICPKCGSILDHVDTFSWKR